MCYAVRSIFLLEGSVTLNCIGVYLSDLPSDRGQDNDTVTGQAAVDPGQPLSVLNWGWGRDSAASLFIILAQLDILKRSKNQLSGQ